MNKDSDEFKNWVETHKSKCHQNFDGSFPNIEAKLLQQSGFGKDPRNMVFNTLSSSQMEFKISHSCHFNKSIWGKVECLNHVAKRLGTGMQKIVTENTGKGDPFGGKNMAVWRLLLLIN